MKDVLQDLEEFCEQNRLLEIQKSLEAAEKVLDEEIRIREETQLFPDVELAKTGS
jgi:hypothetical protein